MRILIVEDEPDLLDALKKQLQSSGYSVDACGDGLDAEHYLQMASYDAVVQATTPWCLILCCPASTGWNF